MEKAEFALESFKSIQELIRFIDQKAGAVLVIAGLAFNGFIAFAKDLQLISFTKIQILEAICLLSAVVSILCLMIVLWISIFKVLKPRLSKQFNKNDHSLIYFEHLSRLGEKDIITEYKLLSQDQMLEDLVKQQFELSQIMVNKTKYLAKSFNYLFASILSIVLFIISTLMI